MAGRGIRVGYQPGVPAWVTTLAATPRRWDLLGNGLKAIEMRFNPAMNPLYDLGPGQRPPWGMSNWDIEGTFAWSNGAKHPTLPYFLRFGGGHGDSAYNGIPRLDLDADTPTFSHQRWGDGTVGHWDGLDQLGFDARDSTYDDYASTGNPRSAHTYNGVCIAPNDVMYVTQGYKAGLGGVNGHTLWGYDIAGDSWSAVTTLPSGGAAFRDFCHVPTLGASGSLVGIGGGNAEVQLYDIAAGTWSGSASYTNTSDGARMVYVPEPWDCVVGLNYVVGEGFFMHAFGRYTLTGGNEIRPPTTGTRPFTTVENDVKSGCWVPSLGAIVGWKWGANLWTLTPPTSGDPRDTWTWGEIAADPENTVVPEGRPGAQAPQVFGGFFHHQFGPHTVVGLSVWDATVNTAVKPYFMVL